MTSTSFEHFPLVMEPKDLESELASDLASELTAELTGESISQATKDNLLIVDLSNPDSYQRMHIPGAVHCPYSAIITSRPPVMGLVPDETTLSHVFSQLGLTPDKQVVAYDDEGNGKASRFIFTLHCIGHTNTTLLNGGMNAWAAEGHTLESGNNIPEPTEYRATLIDDSDNSPIATREYIEALIADGKIHSAANQTGEVQIIDTRSAAEYAGIDLRAARGGHIPGAINFDWTEAMDRMNNLRHQSKETLLSLLADKGISPDKPTILYCQTHHRSAHTYVALKSLGFTDVKGYPGAWSEWGNDPSTSIE